MKVKQLLVCVTAIFIAFTFITCKEDGDATYSQVGGDTVFPQDSGNTTCSHTWVDG